MSVNLLKEKYYDHNRTHSFVNRGLWDYPPFPLIKDLTTFQENYPLHLMSYSHNNQARIKIPGSLSNTTIIDHQNLR